MIDLIALIVGTVTTALIGLTVYIKNNKSITSKLFVGLSSGLIGWSIATFFSLHTANDHQTLFWQRPIMFFVVMQSTSFLLLARAFPKNQFNFLHYKKYVIFILFSIVTAIIALSPFLFVDFKHGSPVPGPGMAIFLPFAIISNIGGLIMLTVRTHRSRGAEKTQLQYFLAATLLNFTFVPIANFVFPLAFKNNKLLILSPLFSVIFSGFIAYAIIAKKLFDLKTAIARSVAYVLIIGSLTVIYSIGLFGIIDVFFGGANKELLRQVLSIILLTPLAISFQYVKRFFDRITNNLFYRDNYDLQEVFDKIGDILVAEIDLKRILNGTRNVLSVALKSSFMEFVLIRDEKPYFEAKHKLESQLLALSEHINGQHKELVATDELHAQSELREHLVEAKVALSLRLRTQRQLVGYILLGEKRSGDVYNNQDLRLLTMVASELAIAIENALRFEEIENFNITLQQKVLEATHELRKSNEKLKALDETKDDFISMASHQLRTPLTSVKGYISMVLEGDAGKLNDIQKKLLEQSFYSSQRMVFLIADLLNVSRLRTGKFIIDPAPVNLAEMVQQEVDQLHEGASSKKIALSYQEPKEFPLLMLDETKTRQVIMNFIDNALYYTPAGGNVRVELQETAASIELKIVDNGIGVPKAEQHHLFTKFYRAGNARKARPDGTGLGLFMAKKVVIAQGGAVIFESEEGKGSTFGFAFSKTKLAPPASKSVAHNKQLTKA